MMREEQQVMWRFAAVLIGCAMPAMLLGRAVTAVCLALGILLGLLATHGTSLRSSLRYMAQSKLLWIAASLVVSFGLSTVFSIDVSHSLQHFVQLLGIGVMAFLFYLVVREMPARMLRLSLQSLCITTLVVLVLVLVDAFGHDPRLAQALHGDKAQNLHRLNYMSSVLAVLIPFLWAWLLQREREHEVLASRFAVPVSILSFWAVFACGGRAGWVAATLAAAVFLVVTGRRFNLTLHTKHWLIGIVVVVLGPLFYGLSRGFDVMMARISMAGEHYGIGSGRVGIWEFAVSHMFDNPLTGIGLGAFRKLPLPAEGIISNSHPHNFVLQLGLESGILGLLAGLALMVFLLRQFWVYAQGNIYGLAAFCSLLAFFTASLANTSIFQAWWLTFLVFVSIFGLRLGWSERRD